MRRPSGHQKRAVSHLKDTFAHKHDQSGLSSIRAISHETFHMCVATKILTEELLDVRDDLLPDAPVIIEHVIGILDAWRAPETFIK